MTIVNGPGRGISSRVRIRYGQGVTTATVRSRGSILSVLTTLLMLGFWTFGGLFAGLMLMVEFDNGRSGAFFLIWLVAWVIAEAAMMVALLWQLFGRTVIAASSNGITVSRRILGIGPSRHYAPHDVSGFSYVFDDPRTTVKVNGRRIPQSALRVHANPHMFSVATGIPRDDADAMIQAFNQRLGRQARAA